MASLSVHFDPLTRKEICSDSSANPSDSEIYAPSNSDLGAIAVTTSNDDDYALGMQRVVSEYSVAW